MSRILSRISMLTGQISSHALHDVHAQISSGVMREKTLSAVTVSSGTCPTIGGTGGVPDSLMTWPTLSTISLGSSGLPVACAGHTLVHRPHTVHASVSSSCFHVKSPTTLAPKLSIEVSARLGNGFMAPLGRSRSDRYMLIGDVNMWRSLVIGRMVTKRRNAPTCTTHKTWCRCSRSAGTVLRNSHETG